MYYSETADKNNNLRDFFKYLEHTGSSENELMSLPVDKRKEIFMKWKWGGSNYAINNDCESTRRYILSTMTWEGVDGLLDDKEKRFWKGILSFEDYCRKVLERIGVYKNSIKEDSEVKQLVSAVGGKLTGGYARKDWDA